MSTEAFDTLQFLLAQVAAESYLDGVHDGESLQSLYVQGANHYTLYEELKLRGELGMTQSTSLMWQDFSDTWEIVSHQKNTASGFSGTLMRNKVTGEYTISFRSTESKGEDDGGDVDRDSALGANGQIKDDGFAWGQIRDMQAFYQSLSAEGSEHYDATFSAHMASQGQLNVTGYSLGGHLAQVFTQLNYNGVLHTYTINGAGMGTINNIPEGQNLGPQLQGLMDTFNQILDGPLAAIDSIGEFHLIDAALQVGHRFNLGWSKEQRVQWFIEKPGQIYLIH